MRRRCPQGAQLGTFADYLITFPSPPLCVYAAGLLYGCAARMYYCVKTGKHLCDFELSLNHLRAKLRALPKVLAVSRFMIFQTFARLLAADSGYPGTGWTSLWLFEDLVSFAESLFRKIWAHFMSRFPYQTCVGPSSNHEIKNLGFLDPPAPSLSFKLVIFHNMGVVTF